MKIITTLFLHSHLSIYLSIFISLCSRIFCKCVWRCLLSSHESHGYRKFPMINMENVQSKCQNAFFKIELININYNCLVSILCTIILPSWSRWLRRLYENMHYNFWIFISRSMIRKNCLNEFSTALCSRTSINIIGFIVHVSLGVFNYKCNISDHIDKRIDKMFPTFQIPTIGLSLSVPLRKTSQSDY